MVERVILTKPEYKVDLLLDSGAFGAWNQGKEINLKEYVKYLQEWKNYIWQYACLDHIPGKPYTPRTTDDVKEAAKKSYRNQQIMKDAGLSPIPVYHQGEDPKWLEKMLAEGEPYIGVSPLDDTPRQAQQNFLDLCYTIICDSKGMPLVKTHGFGTTSFQFFHRYPLTTADSTTWSYGIAYGRVYIPHITREGRPRYDIEPAAAFVSGAGISDEFGGRPKFNLMGPELLQPAIVKYMKEIVGCDMFQIRYSTYWRRRAAIVYLEGLAAATSGKPFINRQASLLTPVKVNSGKTVPATRSMVYATAMSKDRSILLNDMNIRKRLLSYLDLREDPEALVRYVETGSATNLEDDLDERNGVTNKGGAWKMAYRNYRALKVLDRIEAYEKREAE